MTAGVLMTFHDPRRYSISICKGAGLIADTRLLVERWKPGESASDFVQRGLQENLLGRYTACRSRDILRRVFARRYLQPDSRPASLLKCILGHHLPHLTFTEFVLLYSCRTDPLIYDFTAGFYWPAVQRRRTHLSIEDGLSFLADAISAGHIPQPWSLPVQRRIASGLLGMLRDVGMLRETGRTKPREIVPYEMTDEALVILARELHEQDLSDLAIAEHPDWRLWGLNRVRLLDRLSRLGESRGLIVQYAGSVVRMTWKVSSMEELLDVIAR